jgi:AcrR family transcriptional regulator
MVRWEPGTAERLQKAALELFAMQGFEQTTATQIAQAVGLTERTFFRHFSDKREVLFQGQQVFGDAFLTGMAQAPADAPVIEVVACALRNSATIFPDERRPFARTRQSVISQNPALQERERNKLADLADELADALRARGVEEPAATLAAQSCVAVFAVAFAQWIREGEQRPFAELAAWALQALRTLTAPPTA